MAASRVAWGVQRPSRGSPDKNGARNALNVFLAGSTFSSEPAAKQLKRSGPGTVEVFRARAPYAFGPWMLYATGGAAWVNYKLSASGFGVTVSDDATKAAWTIGGGVEWMFLPKWSVKAEYLYLDTGTTTVTLFGVPISGRAKNSVARLGVNYHF
jgi:opacity protein-like surface antigen